MEAGDELEPFVVAADHDRDEHALQLDRAGERLYVLGIEVADVVGDADSPSATRRPVVVTSASSTWKISSPSSR
jgi:hypothetical protein